MGSRSPPPKRPPRARGHHPRKGCSWEPEPAPQTPAPRTGPPPAQGLQLGAGARSPDGCPAHGSCSRARIRRRFRARQEKPCAAVSSGKRLPGRPRAHPATPSARSTHGPQPRRPATPTTHSARPNQAALGLRATPTSPSPACAAQPLGPRRCRRRRTRSSPRTDHARAHEFVDDFVRARKNHAPQLMSARAAVRVGTPQSCQPAPQSSRPAPQSCQPAPQSSRPVPQPLPGKRTTRRQTVASGYGRP